MNRRNFLKAITAFVGAAAIPTALVEACQIDAPTPKDWLVGLLDSEGNVYAQAAVDSLKGGTLFNCTRAGTVVNAFVECTSFGLPRMILPLTNFRNVCVMPGDTITLDTSSVVVL